MGGARGARPPPPATSSPFLDQTETRIAEKSLKEAAPLPLPPNFAKIMVLILHKEVESKLESVRLVWS